MYKGLEAGLHYFWINEDEGPGHVWLIGQQYNFRYRGLSLAPGIAAAFGRPDDPGAAFTFSAKFEHRWFVAQYIQLYSFSRTALEPEQHESPHPGATAAEQTIHASISDGNHVSARWKRLEAGGSWEHIHFRAGNEWKGGTRIKFRLTDHFSLLAYVLAPKPEARFGFMIHPREE